MSALCMPRGSAFEQRLVALAPELRRYALRLAGNIGKADDLVQETFLRALRGRSGFTEGTNLRAWTFTIMRNFFLASKNHEHRYAEWEDWLDHTLTTSGGQEAHAELSRVASDLADMPRSQRNAILLVAVNGMTYEEAAEQEGCAVGTMKSRVSRGRVALLANYLPRNAICLDDAPNPSPATARVGAV